MKGLTESFYPWSTPLFIHSLDQHEDLKPNLLRDIYKLSSLQVHTVESEVALSAKYNLVESRLDFLSRIDVSDSLLKLNAALVDLLSLVITETNLGHWPDNVRTKTEITESWYHVTHQGGYHDIHSHPNCSWCGIYCLESEEVSLQNKSGVNRFYDPRQHADQYQDAGNLYVGAEGVWDIALEEGQVIIFPSYIKHSALPYQGKKNRVVIAFNSQTHFIKG